MSPDEVNPSCTVNDFMVTSFVNVFAGNTPPLIADGEILPCANIAAKLPHISTSPNVALLVTDIPCVSLTGPLTFILLLNDASPKTINISLTIADSLRTNNFMVTLFVNVFAGNTPPSIADGGILAGGYCAKKLPHISTSLNVALLVTANACRLTGPLTFIPLLNDTSPKTVNISPIINDLFMVTSLVNVFAGNTPPLIADGGILPGTNCAAKLPHISTSALNVALVATDIPC